MTEPLSIAIDSGIEFCVLLGVWILLVGKASGPELLVGAACAAFGATADALAKASDWGRFYIRLKEIALSALEPWYVTKDTVTVLTELARRISGKSPRTRLTLARFNKTKDTEPERTDRALTETLGSYSPNIIVVGIDCEKRTILLHELVPQRQINTLMKKLGVRR